MLQRHTVEIRKFYRNTLLMNRASDVPTCLVMSPRFGFFFRCETRHALKSWPGILWLYETFCVPQDRDQVEDWTEKGEGGKGLSLSVSSSRKTFALVSLHCLPVALAEVTETCVDSSSRHEYLRYFGRRTIPTNANRAWHDRECWWETEEQIQILNVLLLQKGFSFRYFSVFKYDGPHSTIHHTTCKIP